jgi:hypothetical protein
MRIEIRHIISLDARTAALLERALNHLDGTVQRQIDAQSQKLSDSTDQLAAAVAANQPTNE